MIEHRAKPPLRYIGGTPPLRILYLPLIAQRIKIAKTRDGLRNGLKRYAVVYELDRRAQPHYNLANLVRRYEIDILFTQYHGAANDLTPDMLRQARKARPGLVVLNWCGDATPSKLTGHRALDYLRQVDLQMTKQASCFPVYQKRGIRYAYWQQNYEHPNGKKLPRVPAHDLVCLMNVSGAERRVLAETIEGKIAPKHNAGLYGTGWRKASGFNQYDYAHGEALYKKATLAIGDTYPGTIGFFSNRVIQCMAAGGALMLLQYSPELERYTGMKACEHYVEWDEPAELPDLVARWLSPECAGERKRIVENAQRFVMARYTAEALTRWLFYEILPKVESIMPIQLPFDQPHALAINAARMEHLRGLNILQSGDRVLDLGAGIGRLSAYLREWECNVVAVEGRDDNVAEARRRYPDLDIRRGDVEAGLIPESEFDAAFMYGLLYHLRDPVAALRNVSSRAPVLILESIVTDAAEPDMYPVTEPASARDQSMVGQACRPTPAFIVEALREAGYAHVYTPRTPPDHPDYRWKARNKGKSTRDGHNLRRVFVASRAALDNVKLVEVKR